MWLNILRHKAKQSEGNSTERRTIFCYYRKTIVRAPLQPKLTNEPASVPHQAHTTLEILFKLQT